MNTDKKRSKYTTFVLFGNLPRWIVLITALILLFLAFWGTEYYTYRMAIRDLSLTPDYVNSDGVIMQMTDYACAPASLAMLMRDKGLDVTTLDMAKAAYTGIFGTWGRSIPLAGRQYGFKVTVKFMDFDEIIDTNMPMIIEEHGRRSVHAVYAVPDLQSRILHVKDPSVGYSVLDKIAFDEYFIGNAPMKCYIFEQIR